MPSLSNLDSAYLLIAFFVPGFIISLLRSQFLTGNERSGAEQFLKYLTYSALNYGLWGWLIYWVAAANSGLAAKTILWFFVILVAPAGLGTLMGVSAQRGWGGRLLKLVKLHTVHPVATAWDWRFHNTGDNWVMVRLKNDIKWAGYIGAGSFISSDLIQRDIYIQEVFEVDDDNKWTPRGTGVLINAGEISTIEFWPITAKAEKTDG